MQYVARQANDIQLCPWNKQKVSSVTMFRHNSDTRTVRGDLLTPIKQSRTNEKSKRSTPSPGLPPTSVQPFNLSRSNRSPRTPSGVHRISASGYSSSSPSISRTTTPRSSKRTHSSLTPSKKILFSPPKEAKVITPSTEIRAQDEATFRSSKTTTYAKGVDDHRLGNAHKITFPRATSNATSDEETTSEAAVRDLNVSSVVMHQSLAVSSPIDRIQLTPTAVSSIPGGVPNKPSPKLNSAIEKLLKSPSKSLSSPDRHFHHSLLLSSLAKESREVDCREYNSSTKSRGNVETELSEASTCSTSQDGDRKEHAKASLSPYRLQTTIVEPTPVRQAKALEEDLFGYMRELESLTTKLLPFEEEQIKIQRRREELKCEQEENTLRLQSLQAAHQQWKQNEDNALKRILRLDERMQQMGKEAEQREGRSAEEIRILKLHVHKLTVATQEQNGGNVDFSPVALIGHSLMCTSVVWNMVFWMLVRFPFFIIQTTSAWLSGLVLLGAAYSYLSSHETLHLASVPCLDNSIGVV